MIQHVEIVAEPFVSTDVSKYVVYAFSSLRRTETALLYFHCMIDDGDKKADYPDHRSRSVDSRKVSRTRILAKGGIYVTLVETLAKRNSDE